jgi:hypothetical protein
MVKKKNEMCDIHQEDIDEMKKDILNIKTDISMLKAKLDNFIENVKPNFTLKDKLTFILGLFVYTVVISYNFSKTDARSLDNKEKVDKIEYKIDKIYDLMLKKEYQNR